MCRNFEMPRERNVPTLLVGNEPNAIEPYGHPTTPKEAANAIMAIERDNPQTRLIVGGVSADDWRSLGGWGSGISWLRGFLWEYYKISGHRYSQGLACHVYTQHSADWAINKLQEYRRLYSGEMWLTEWGVMSGDPIQFKRILNYAMKVFARVSPYTNRQPGSCGGGSEDWEIGKGVELVNCNGSLTPIGQVYASQP